MLHPFFTSRLSLRLIWFISRNSSRYDLVYLDFSQVFLYGPVHSRFPAVPDASRCYLPEICPEDRCATIGGLKMDLPSREAAAFRQKKKKTLLTFSEKDRELIKTWYGKDAKVVSPFLDPMILDLEEADFTESDYFCFYGAWNRSENTEGPALVLRACLPGPSVAYPHQGDRGWHERER